MSQKLNLGQPAPRKGVQVDPETRKGLNQNKYKVQRTDRSTNVGQKHHDCEYFVLDLSHDKFAGAALRAYAKACVDQYPYLADDLIRTMERLGIPTEEPVGSPDPDWERE